jgi:hypothetical protein
MHIKFTYVDSVTQISVEKEPAKHGPHFPKIKGLNYLFALERKYPTMVPEFIGECDDDAEQIDGFLKVLDEAEVAQEQQAEADSQAHRVRVDRTLRLQASDWTQLADATVDQNCMGNLPTGFERLAFTRGFPLGCNLA